MGDLFNFLFPSLSSSTLQSSVKKYLQKYLSKKYRLKEMIERAIPSYSEIRTIQNRGQFLSEQFFSKIQ